MGETGEPFEMEFPLRAADGTFRWFLTRIRPLRDADGRIVRWFGSNTNIDERRRNDAFRETFLGVLGHDPRNQLNTILTTTRVLTMRSDVPPEVEKRLERVSSSGVRMQRMIEQLLDMTRARLARGIPVTLSDEELPLAPGGREDLGRGARGKSSRSDRARGAWRVQGPESVNAFETAGLRNL